MCKNFIMMVSILLSMELKAQQVILFENFEGDVSEWTKSITETGPTDNEWFLLNVNSSFTAGNLCVGVSSGGGNTYNNTTSDHSLWVTPSWPAIMTDKEVKIQFDAHSDGEIIGTGFDQYDLMSIHLVEMADPNIPFYADINATNSILIGYIYDTPNWTRYEVTLNATQLSFIQNATTPVKLVFNWINDSDGVREQPPAALDNVLITYTEQTKPPLAGDYTIGLIEGEHFGTLTAAFNYLNTYGQTADVNFYLSDEDYSKDFETFPLILGDGTTAPYAGMGTYKLTLKPSAGVTPEIRGSNYNLKNKGTINFWGINNLEVDGSNSVGGTSRDLSISASGGSNFMTPVYLAAIDEATTMQDISLKNLYLSTNTAVKGYGIIAGAYTADTTDLHFATEGRFDNLNISNNAFATVMEAIHVDGADRDGLGFTSSAYATNVTTSDNYIISPDASSLIGEYGIHYLGVNGGVIAGNDIGDFDHSDLNADAGVVIDKNCQNLIIEKNKIQNIGFDGDATSSFSAHAINVYTGLANSGIEIRNNEIMQIAGNGASSTANSGFLNPVAIFLGLGGEAGWMQTYTQSGIQVYNNSIYMYGNEMDFTTSISMGIAVAANTTDVDFRNNVIKNDLGGANTLGGKASALAIYIEGNSGQLSNMDYNGYHITADETHTRNYIGLVGSLTDLLSDGDATLNDWRVRTGHDNASVFGNPGFTSFTNLAPDPANPDSWNISGLAVPIASVTVDKNDVARPVSVEEGAPDMGAFEFEADPIQSLPVASILTGPFVAETDYIIEINQHERMIIRFAAGYDLPDEISVRFFSGDWAEDPLSYNIMNNYFDIEVTGDPSNTYDYSLTVPYNPNYLGTTSMVSGNVSITNDHDNDGNFETNSTIVDEVGQTFTANSLNRWGRFTVTSNVSPLPVELLYFDAKALEITNILIWETISEVNNDYFIVEKSNDGMQWRYLGEVDGHGTSMEHHHYQFTDPKPDLITYYRIIQVDVDGKQEVYDPMRVQRYPGSEIQLRVWPNPVQDVVYLSTDDMDPSGLPFKVLDLYGSVMIEETMDTGNNMLSVEGWPSGIYFIHVSGFKTFKIIKD